MYVYPLSSAALSVCWGRPFTGFANAVVSPAIDFKSEGFVTGMAAKMFTVAGPVITFGTLASVIYGVILMLFQ